MYKRVQTDWIRLRKRLVTGVVAAFAAIAAHATPSQALEVTFMSGGAKGDWFRYLTASSECLRQFSDVHANVIPNSGGMEAFKRVSAGQGQFTYAFQNELYPAYYGKGKYEGKAVTTLLAVGRTLAASMVHLVVLESSGIKTLADLKGKTVSPGPNGTVSYSIVSDLLKAAGVYDEIKVANISHGEQVSYLKDGKIAAFGITTGLPGPRTTELAVSNKIRIIPMAEELKKVGFFKEHPYYSEMVIPAGTYNGVNEDVATVGVTGVMVANSDVSEDIVYQVTKNLWGPKCVDYLTKNHPGLAVMGAENPTEGLTTPLHPGAKRFWAEKGIKVQ
ncbi:MAG: TAXI family TRAP transporter solute-binding subunit [Hyphomicrobiales bacterium]